MATVTERRRGRRHAVGFSSRLMDVGSATDVGRVREANEDSMLILQPDGERKGELLVAVADGMGGHKAGEVASALAVLALRQAMDAADAHATPDALLKDAVQLG